MLPTLRLRPAQTAILGIQPFAHFGILHVDLVVGSAEPAAHRLVVGANVVIESRTQAIPLCDLCTRRSCCNRKRQDDQSSVHPASLARAPSALYLGQTRGHP